MESMNLQHATTNNELSKVILGPPFYGVSAHND